MATVLKFLNPAASGTEILPAASGGFNTLGFYGAGFGLSVRVGEFNETTYRTTEDGQSNGGQLNNLEWANTSGAYVNGSITATELVQIGNGSSTLRVYLGTDVAVQTQNSVFRAFDKVSIDNVPSGVDVYAAEIIKPGAGVGSGDVNWTAGLGGSGTVLSLDDQPISAQEHNWYIGLSASPTSIGEKTDFAFYFETEFL